MESNPQIHSVDDEIETEQLHQLQKSKFKFSINKR